MGVHVLHFRQIVPISIEECWAFFSDPRNLAKITPPDLDFRVLSEVPPVIHPGLMIQYRVRPLLGLPLRWLSEITQVAAPRYFVDEQRAGPYALWHHEHFFTAQEDGGTEIRDQVHYAVPFGPLGELVHPFLVAPNLAKIFAFREQAVRARFGG